MNSAESGSPVIPSSSALSASGRPPARRMRPVELMGAHTHATTVGVNVHIYERDGKYLARGRYERKMFGQNLGADVATAQSRLRHLLTEIEKGTFRRPSEARKRPLGSVAVPQMDLRDLSNEFLMETRKLRGARTAKDYQNRLAPVLDFCEQPDARKRWPLARDIDRAFVIELRAYLMARQITRNGRPGASPKCMSARQVLNCLTTLRTLLNWAVRADVRKLPPEFANPVARELVGPRPMKDPLRTVKLPLPVRCELVGAMDAWQLLHLWPLFVLPLRFEDVAGLLISDVDFTQRTLRLGTRLGGNDFNKCRLDIALPLPEELLPLLRAGIGDRREGPLVLSRAVWSGRRKKPAEPASLEELTQMFEAVLQAAPAGRVESEQDRKQAFRKLLRDLGGVSEDRISKELKAVFANDPRARDVRPYDIRGSVSQDLKDADLRHLELRYLTEHAVGDILNEYVSLDPAGQMAKYFRHIQPLLEAITARARELDVAHG